MAFPFRDPHTLHGNFPVILVAAGSYTTSLHHEIRNSNRKMRVPVRIMNSEDAVEEHAVPYLAETRTESTIAAGRHFQSVSTGRFSGVVSHQARRPPRSSRRRSSHLLRNLNRVQMEYKRFGAIVHQYQTPAFPVNRTNALALPGRHDDLFSKWKRSYITGSKHRVSCTTIPEILVAPRRILAFRGHDPDLCPSAALRQIGSCPRNCGISVWLRPTPGHQEQRPDCRRSTMVRAKPKVVRDAGACNRRLVAVLTALCLCGDSLLVAAEGCAKTPRFRGCGFVL